MQSGKPVLVSGIKPTGELHIGNYFGALRQFVELANSGSYDTHVFVADYHALNFVQDRSLMQQHTRELVLSYLAAGLSPENTTLFKQSSIPAHTELCWIFDTLTPMPYLMLAHAFKAAVDKAYFEMNDVDEILRSEIRPDDESSLSFRNKVSAMFSGVSVGTFNYPMLMAADILLYDAAVVPVGQDQKQHIEYARDTAQKFNRIFGETFKLPEPLIVEEVAVVPGIDGQKMSKSYGNTIRLFAPREEIVERVMAIVTDSSGDRPENVYAIHRLIKSEAELAPVYEEHKGKYKALKEALIEDLDAYLAPLRERYLSLKENPSVVDDILATGAEVARAKSEATMRNVRSAIGVS